MRVVGIKLRVSYRPGAIDNETRGHGERPTVVPVGLGKVDVETAIQRFQIIWKRPPQPISMGDFVAGIMQDFEIQILLLNESPVVLGFARGDGNQRRIQAVEVVDDFVQSFQLCVAVGSPVSPEKRHDGRTLFQKPAEADLLATAVGKIERRRPLPDPRHTIGNPRIP